MRQPPEADPGVPDRIAVIVNAKAGAVRRHGLDVVTEAYRKALAGRLVGVYPCRRGGEIEASARRALADGATAIFPIGGDGTCAALAEMARREGFVSSALPGGTRNILARRLWGDADIMQVAQIVAEGAFAIRRMDAGEANGRLFFVGASFGMIPHLARARERLRGRAEPSGVWAAIRHVLRLGRRGLLAPRIRYTPPGGAPERCAALMASVHSLDEMLFRAGEKAEPAFFDCAAATPQGWFNLSALALRALWSERWRDDPAVRAFETPALTIEGRDPLVAALDGEAALLKPPVRLVMLQDAIPLIGGTAPRS